MRISDWSSDVCSSDLRDRRPLLLHQLADEATEERAMGSRIVERLERSEARRFPVAQREIGAAAGSDKNFRALILVDEDMARVELFELRHQEVDQHRLTAARWTNDHRMAQVCRMEIEVIGAASACLEQGD